ncbi:fibronectin type III domain-containing protein [Paenibacillus sp. NPDC058071]|uniref:fibronectin type III domain-containing protein n=1 Tax=Paenibacillus sp. NPDC058071 TaxID=3346326 RepID=UPI0036DA7DD2
MKLKQTAMVLLCLALLWTSLPMAGTYAAPAEGITGTYYWEQQVKQAGDSWPRSRTAPLMAYHQEQGYVLMFGGWTPTGRLNDTWKFQNGKWTQLNTATKPPVRSGGGMVYDEQRKQILMFGGDGATSQLGDTWVWDVATNNWIQKTPAQSPPGRGVMQMAYDGKNKNVVLFGGISQTIQSLDDTWTWNGTTWQQRNVTVKPPKRDFGMIAFDGSNVVMFGGEQVPGNRKLNDMWVWDGTAWSERTITSSKPSARHGSAFAYDPQYKKIVLYGGYSNKIESDAWALTGSTFTPITPNVTLKPRNDATMVYDNGKEQFVMFGGYDIQGNTPTDETWTLTILPSLSPVTVLDKDLTTGQVKSSVIDQANSPITERGFLYSTSNTDPRVGGTAVIKGAAGSGLGEFSATLSGLAQNTTVYVRSYAINAQGTAYSAVTSFVTDQFSGKLSALGLTGVQTNISFNSGVFDYTLIVPANADQLQLSPTAADNGAYIYINGKLASSLPATVKLDYGENLITVNSRSSNGKYKGSDYTLTITRPLAAPKLATPSASSGQVFLDWGPVDGAQQYLVYRSTVSGSGGQLIATLNETATSYTADGLANGTTYYFTVTAKRGQSESALSNEVTAKPLPAPPAAPIIVSADSGDGEATLSWNPVEGADGYHIYVLELAGGYSAPYASTAGLSYNLTGLTNGTNYHFIVRAYTMGVIGEASEEVVVTPQVPAPDAPTLTNSVAGDGTVSINWLRVPQTDSYKVYQSENSGQAGLLVATVGESVYSYQASGLTNGTTYYFTVIATNAGGDSPSSNEISAVPYSVAGAPTQVSAEAGDGTVEISFDPPANNGGKAIEGYVVTVMPGNRMIEVDATTTTVVVDGLTNGKSYSFTVAAKNLAGAGTPSTAVNEIPFTTPEAPTGLTLVSGNGEVQVSFDPPANNGGRMIDEYIVTIMPGNREVTGTSSPIVVDGLTNGTVYSFTVKAKNEAGEGVASGESRIAPSAVPGAPTNVQAKVKGGKATVSFDPPVNDGGKPITGYKVIVLPSGREVQGTTSPITVDNLTDGVDYTFIVKAVNENGESNTSEEVGTAPSSVPSAPADVHVESGNGRAVVSFDPPANNGSSPVDGYVVIVQPGNRVIEGNASPIVVEGLTNGVEYTFTVQAKNADGNGTPSTEVKATPFTVPGVPTGVRAEGGNGTAIVSFDPPADNGGKPIEGYIVTVMPGGKKVEGTGSPITIDGLTNGVSYTFTVTAKNEAGEGGASAESAPVVPNGSGGSTPQQPQPQPSQSPQEPAGVDLIVNGKPVSGGATKNETVNGRTVVVTSVDEAKLKQRLEGEKEGVVVVIPVQGNAQTAAGELTGGSIKDLQRLDGVIELHGNGGTYTLPASSIELDKLAAGFGPGTAVEDIRLRVEISIPSSEVKAKAEQAAAQRGVSIVGPVIEFSVKANYGGQESVVRESGVYTTKTIALPKGTDPKKITTGVIVEADGTLRHVPTKVVVVDGIYYAQINSLTNGVYSVIWNEAAFKDTTKHWANEAIHDMASRTVINGYEDGTFKPDQAITRAEFAAIIVRALGLGQKSGAAPFADVKQTDWYSGVIDTAYAYDLIQGYSSTEFAPGTLITREQALAITARAMKLTGIYADLSEASTREMLSAYKDGGAVANWASLDVAQNLKADLIQGRSNGLLAPKQNITRAEVAVIVQRLLSRSNLI